MLTCDLRSTGVFAAADFHDTAADFGFVAGPVVIGVLADSLLGSESFGLIITALLLALSGTVWLAAVRRTPSGV